MKLRTLILSGALLVTGCSGLQPVPVVAGDVCFRCRRIISDVRMAAEIVDDTGHAMKFRTASCMAKFVKDHPQETLEGIFVTDFSTGRMIKASAATFVPMITGEGYTKELDYVAYGTTKGADEAAAREKTTSLDWQKVVETVVD